MFAVVQFPGSNDDRDMRFAIDGVLKAPAQLVWHKDTELPPQTSAVVLPGGFSYGDYLRCGAMAKYSPVMAAVKRFADAGGPVLGVCNGFQVLCESGMLPGVLQRNHDLHFVCDFVTLRVERAEAPFFSRARPGQLLRMPIKNGEGAYFVQPAELEQLEARGQILVRYCDTNGEVTEVANPSGALAGIAGVRNRAGNVFGLMPHPEHAVEPAIGGTDGAVLLGSMIDAALVREERR